MLLGNAVAQSTQTLDRNRELRDIIMKVASYQAPLLTTGSMEALDLIADQVRRCESAGVDILCCPEGVLGGLADYAPRPRDIGIERSRLQERLAPLASQTVTTILGFTEVGKDSLLYNAAAILNQGSVIGVYRKLHPALNKSVYSSGQDTPVFRVGDVTFGIVICLDSRYPELARLMTERGAIALFVPTNNGMPPNKGGRQLVGEARQIDIDCAVKNRIWVIRSDVAGRADGLVSYGASAIVDPDGTIVQSAEQLEPGLLTGEVETGWHRSVYQRRESV